MLPVGTSGSTHVTAVAAYEWPFSLFHSHQPPDFIPVVTAKN